MKTLDPADLELTGRRLIEASAGTGKTFNITRLYLRALLEKQLSVHQILVLTFTEAATDELKQRIAEYINEVIENWWDTTDPFLQGISQKVDKQAAFSMLKAAAIDIDDASIFTIHGFCQRLLSQYATSFQYASNTEIQIDTRSTLLNLVSDSLIRWRTDEVFFAELQEHGLATPESILSQFHDVFYKKAKVEVINASSLAHDLIKSVNDTWGVSASIRQQLVDFIASNKSYFLDGLAQSQKNTDQIYKQLDEISVWLTDDSNSTFAENEAVFADAVEAGKNPAAEKCILLPLLKTVVEGRRKKYQPDFYAKLIAIYKPLKSILLSGLRFEGAVIINQSNKLPVYQQLVTEIQSINQKLKQHLDDHKFISFDYMIEKVSTKLVANKDNSQLIASIKAQYPLAMIDEFQDTDDSQYAIFDCLYPPASRDTCLIMIGDPKQAIYAFRGGDVFTYINARTSADESLTMGVNWRSSYAMINAINCLFTNASGDQLGPGIAFHEVSGSIYSKAQQKPMLTLDTQKNIEDSVHFVLSNANQVASTASDEYSHRIGLIQWMATEIIDLLANTGFKEDATSDCVQLHPKDIAILVRTGYEATLIRNEFKKYNLESVYLSERTPLFSSLQASDVLYALDAILHLDDSQKLRIGIATGLFFVDQDTSAENMLADDLHPAWQAVINHIADLKRIWLHQGLYAVMYTIIRTASPPKKLVERSYANLIHLAEEFAQLEVTVNDPSEQCRWLKKQIARAETSSVELRLESDKALIKIVTMHKSKGLEYPVVFVPFANSSARFASQSLYPHHDDDGHLKITMGFSSDAAEKAKAEYHAENMRLLYVALTRSLYRCYLGVIASNNATTSALYRLLGIGGLSDEEGVDAYHNSFEELVKQKCASALQHIVFRQATSATEEKYQSLEQISKLSHQHAARDVFTPWQMSSFSKMTRESESVVIDTRESEQENVSDASEISAVMPDNDVPIAYRFIMTPGANSGNLLHDMLENVNFQSPDYTSVWQQIKAKYLWFEEAKLPELSAWLDECLHAPILSDGCHLASLRSSNVLKEPNFYMPSMPVVGKDITRVLTAHRKTVCEYLGNNHADIEDANHVAIPYMVDQSTNMIVQGFIDLVFCHAGKYYVVDYKSSYLGDSYSDYSKYNMWRNMQSHNYDLQYHFYALALHRLLQQRMEDYSPKKHFGGVIYLYVRGMHVDAPGNGVFFVPPDAICLTEVDALMAEGY